jgi:hypothetical protein
LRIPSKIPIYARSSHVCTIKPRQNMQQSWRMSTGPRTIIFQAIEAIEVQVKVCFPSKTRSTSLPQHLQALGIALATQS